MYELDINVSSKYKIVIKNNLISEFNNYIKSIYNHNKVFIVTDERVAKLYLNKIISNLKDFDVESVIIEGYEKSKSIEVYNEVLNSLVLKGIKRNHLILALGGGVIGDLTGFVASTLYRGIDFVQIPTTLLAQMDSSIGGKVAINLPVGKNLVGNFYHPKLVLIDPLFLDTLPPREFSSGMAELIKHAFIGDKSIIDLLTKNDKITEEIVYKSLLVKKKVVEEDEFDKGLRMILNFGHTFGHAIEKESNYNTYTHGEAVSIGMLMAIRLGEKLNITKIGLYEILENILSKYNLLTEKRDFKKYIELIKFDKKNIAGTLNFILLKDFEKPIIYPVLEDKLKEIGDL